LSIILVSSCSSNNLAPVSERGSAASWRPNEYLIQRGDTLYSIAWEFGLNYKDLARWNRLSSPDKIIAGHHLRLSAPATSKRAKPATTKRATKVARSPPQRTSKVPVTKKPSKKRQVKKPATRSSTQIKWQWPTTGKLAATYSPTLGHNRGLNIAGKLNQPIKAAASGVVVYAGEGLQAYGRMIIIKHSERYLSAYANNHVMNVREGQRIKSGQTIARMGRRIDGRTMLHFEIRRNGKPVDPQKYLPKRR